MASEQTFEDKLAIQLMECAILVKKGERTNPLVLETLEKLRDFCHPEGAKERRFSNASGSTTAAAAGNTAAATNNHTKPQAHQGGPVMKPTLGGVLGKMMGMSADDHHPKKTAEQKAATSQKNAARVKADIAADGDHSLNQSGGSSWLPVFGNHSSNNVTEEAPRQQSSTAGSTSAPVKGRPEFQRPSNSKSALIANGWIEQQRRSRMRTVWKDVLASLVEGRKPGEETTLWIQRQITNSVGQSELEALHQIPVKWLEEVTFLDYSADNRFSLRVYNLNEEFVFRCPKDPAAAENWVMTLRSAKEASLKKRDFVRPAPPPPERHQDEKKSGERPTSPQTPAASANPPTPVTSTPQPTPTPAAPPAAAPVAPDSQPPTTGKKKMSIKELRALAHGAGISTIGMERGQLEAVVAALSQPQVPPPQPARPPEPQPDPAEERRRQEAIAEAEARRRLAETRDRQAVEEEAKVHTEAEEAERRRQEEEHQRLMAERKRQEEEHQRLMAERVRSQQEALRKQHDEEERQRLARERQMREEEEMRRRVAQQQAEQQRRQQEENLRREQEEYRRRQEVWQQQHSAEEERRRMAEQQEAERRRQHEEAYRRHVQAQQWQQQQQQQQQNAPHSAPPPWQHQHPSQQQTPFGFPGYQQQQQQQGPQPPPGDNKYAKMAAQKDDNTSTQHIKHAILIHWALQPPMRQGLRRIEDLITSVHTVFPPAFGVPGHEYFSKWTPIVLSDVSDDDKLEKKVKKLRFFLHPDKLPKDLSPDQSFMVRMLWDITSDALEEHKKQKEDLNWIHQ